MYVVHECLTINLIILMFDIQKKKKIRKKSFKEAKAREARRSSLDDYYQKQCHHRL